MKTEFKLEITSMNSGGGGRSVEVGSTPRSNNTSIQESLKSSAIISSRINETYPSIFDDSSYENKSHYLNRNLNILVSNVDGDSFTLEDCKIEVSGQKYIGIQQDMFTITLKNINLQAFAEAINNGYIYVRVVVANNVIFAGSIKSITTARENVVERTITLNCLMKVTDLLSDIVSPITVSSSMNVWHILNLIDNEMVIEVPDEIRDIKFDKNYSFTGTKKTVIEDIIKVLNNQLNRMNMKDLPWLEYELRQDGTLSLFGPTDHIEILNIQPHTGLTDTPTVNDVGISFNSIYKKKLAPGRVVKLDNAYFSTSGSDSAFVYAFDEQGLYVVTEVAYSFSNYPWAFKVSCKAAPLSKYQNFVVK